MFKFGYYPPEFNPKIHGTYDPAVFYGKADKPLSEVAVKDLGSWIMRRNKSPKAMIGAMSRAYWRWNHKYIFPKYANLAGGIQLCVATMFIFYAMNYGKYREHRQFKHHW